MKKKIHGHTLLCTLFLLLFVSTIGSSLYMKYADHCTLRKTQEQQIIAKLMAMIAYEQQAPASHTQTYHFNTGKIIVQPQEEKIFYNVTLNNGKRFHLESSKEGNIFLAP